ncbi:MULTISPECIES: alpha-ketoglutarate-dependent dioxygenase AlkB [Pseudomonas]|uniref:alpha-ketoglutarate-dependent dioxygenase AlkB n=1 Tax=Pseudomonas TaxID=286 RepID=UPI001AE2F294|nr:MULTISPECIES: alpha-ketoglutarate-dependent dioxygenase AlkB [unclassified Pseudomonas]MBP1127242.1 alkylated DNA repair dioxygenase AlkB [Pseudomonas sp. PvP025]MDQ0401102.1 alkylated DNA repair dioxygenase AlkB [Pseudomonas sp. PvP006]
MKKRIETQLDLLREPTQDMDGPQGHPNLVLELDHRSWLQFLSDEWLFPGETGCILLGIRKPCETHISPKLMSVNVWFDHTKLPDLSVIVWRNGIWASTYFSKLTDFDEAVIWNGPLPLFAVERFSVTSSDIRAHLLGQANSFDDIDPPVQPMDIVAAQKIDVPMPSKNIFPFGAKKSPKHWNSLRGAAAMALHCVPTIGPWLQLLSELLTKKQASSAASFVNAPWLRSALCPNEAQLADQDPPLWKAIVHEFSHLDIRNEWRPSLLLNAICSQARIMGGDNQRLDKLIASTESLLKDNGTIRELGITDNPLELALQLVLLRPKPGRYVNWKKDWPSIPPAAWWTGAILTGYLCGFRSLPRYLRGSLEARRLLALRTWQLMDEKSSSEWAAKNRAMVNWSLQHDAILLEAGEIIISEYKPSNRGRWYELDLSNELNMNNAISVAKSFCPEFIKQILALQVGVYNLIGTGRAELDESKTRLSISGTVELSLESPVSLSQRLDIEGFRNWIATSAIQTRLPRLSPLENIYSQSITKSVIEKPIQINTAPRLPQRLDSLQPKSPFGSAPQGLLLIPDFITPKQESSLLAKIESSPWDTTMSRRVQHYGWRYDYKSRKVDAKAYIGPLPSWAANLGRMLFERGLVKELPDQVIVNEYSGNQGITKHIDCLPCFRGEVVTISLLESWEMIFSRKLERDLDEKYKIILTRRSAAVLSGESRTTWYHEIPKHLKEAGIIRHRRISITFRKVDTPA